MMMMRRRAIDSKRTNHLRTTGAPSLSSSITSLFGPKVLPTLLPVDLPLSVEIDKSMAKREGLDAGVKLKVRVVGMISKGEVGMGRTGGGGQYWFLNGRPFHPGKVRSCTFFARIICTSYLMLTVPSNSTAADRQSGERDL